MGTEEVKSFCELEHAASCYPVKNKKSKIDFKIGFKFATKLVSYKLTSIITRLTIKNCKVDFTKNMKSLITLNTNNFTCACLRLKKLILKYGFLLGS